MAASLDGFIANRRKRRLARGGIEFHAGDLAQFVDGRPASAFRSIWFVGGGKVCSECLRLGLADEVRYSILQILIGAGIPFFGEHEGDVALHLAELKAYKSGMVELRYDVRGRSRASSSDG
jgi:dihydrofolate reductase